MLEPGEGDGKCQGNLSKELIVKKSVFDKWIYHIFHQLVLILTLVFPSSSRKSTGRELRDCAFPFSTIAIC